MVNQESILFISVMVLFIALFIFQLVVFALIIKEKNNPIKLKNYENN